jgi:hypothetical protein
MATNNDSFVITPAMLVPAYVKPATLFYPGGTATGTFTANQAASTDNYLPRTLATQAGCPGGTGSAVIAPLPPQQPLDPNYAFAITAEGPAVDTNPTLSVPTVV